MNNDDCRGLQFRMMRKCLKIVLIFSCIRYRQTMQMTCITCSNISSNMFKIALKKHHFKPYFQKNFRRAVVSFFRHLKFPTQFLSEKWHTFCHVFPTSRFSDISFFRQFFQCYKLQELLIFYKIYIHIFNPELLDCLSNLSELNMSH